MHLQRIEWKNDSRIALCWSFYCVNDNKPLDVKCFQLMRCIFCYVSIVLIRNAKTQAMKGLILYNNANGITTLKKRDERELAKNRPHVNGSIIFNFFTTKDSYKKMMCSRNSFWKI
jgi:hypothetical protein